MENRETVESLIAKKLSIAENQVKRTIQLFEEGATIPFISRYRKEMTGGLDEVEVGNIQDQLKRIEQLIARKEAIIKSMQEQGVLTEELQHKIEQSWDSTEIEDIYLPYKPKRKTKAEKARNLGLEPLAKMIMSSNAGNPEDMAEKFVKGEVNDIQSALTGACDIIAEWVSERENIRKRCRGIYYRTAIFQSKLVKSKEEDAGNYRDYFDFEKPWRYCKSHQVLAMLRGESEGVLKVKWQVDEDEIIDRIEERVIRAENASSKYIKEAVKDAFKRLLKPSMETELLQQLKERADDDAIAIFAANLEQLLLQAPLGEKRIMGIDPGYRTGCKVVCIDEKGDLLNNETIYPHPPQKDAALAMKKIRSMVESYNIEAIAIGNGTASRETESFIQRNRFDRKVQVFVVNEAGASIYSASSVARKEFPNYDVTVRGAVSIARRLMDPLAELVKIEPKSIGVGQYQHDVDQKKLKESLDQVVVNCVNRVGVDLNTASQYLLSYVSGLGPQLAENIVQYRKDNGSFESRNELKNVPRLGEKAFEQCAGFLRIRNAKNKLDNSAVHPESYSVVNKMAKDLGVTIEELLGNEDLVNQIEIKRYVSGQIGEPTLKDIVSELLKPGRDPRKKATVFEFSKEVFKPEDVKVGMELPGIVTNITNFGAFVDIGVKINGLIHLSNMADRYISNPTEVVKLHEHLKVKVIEVDLERNRIGLSLKGMD